MKEETTKEYSTPCYQLIRQIMMLIMMIITMLVSLSVEMFQTLLNNKIDDIEKSFNCSKT